MTPLKKLATCATTWLVIGLLGGALYREFTKAHNFTGWTQLKVVHTHSLALGFMLTLIVLLLERAFTLSQHRGAFATYFWGFNLGLMVTITMLVVHGIMQVNGHTDVSPHNLRHCGAWPHQPVSRTHRPHGCLVQVTSDCKSSGSSHNRPLTLEKPLAREEGASARHVSYACGYRHDGGRMRAQRVVDYVPVP
ncbi:DUF2871 domain-containing protein [Cutibacterium modestum]|uniref:DUF2871 domain-containing protein n=1 Tax=Cutibacterium modestum TaxID=2559073 RepID=UPI0020A4C838|nr:DUF2871 domain-containing protein [Cutibacterium modestum]MCP2377383.1 hypothetical protein [Cutibacterium modestum 31N]